MTRHHLKRDRRATHPQIAADFNAGPSTSVSVRIIQRNIIDMGFPSRRPTHLSFLTARDKALRLTKASKHRHWTVDDWNHVAWSDESRFQLNRADGPVRIWRQPRESMDPTCQQGTAQAGGSSVMVWGVCSWRDMGPLIRLDMTLTSDRFDKEWLQEHSSEFRHFRWPPKSPYMDIIEYIWDDLQRAVQKRSPPPLTPTDLWTALQNS
ncbi:transposable element Tcb2 transposase [Trichonephila clavipes]|nr:transposable element Tcb2 transposase [Trichonephila clavipes]